MTFNEYIDKVREEYLSLTDRHRESYWGIGLCMANSIARVKCGKDETKPFYYKLDGGISKGCGKEAFLTSKWASEGRYGVRKKPRDTGRNLQNRVIAARLQFLNNLKDK